VRNNKICEKEDAYLTNALGVPVVICGKKKTITLVLSFWAKQNSEIIVKIKKV
jgi:hypothetical protein